MKATKKYKGIPGEYIVKTEIGTFEIFKVEGIALWNIIFPGEATADESADTKREALEMIENFVEFGTIFSQK